MSFWGMTSHVCCVKSWLTSRHRSIVIVQRFTCPATCPASYLHGQYGHSGTTEGGRDEVSCSRTHRQWEGRKLLIHTPPAAKPRWQFDTRAETDPPSVPRTQSPLQLYSTAVRTLQYHSEYFTTNDIHHNFETVHNIVLLSLWYYSTIAFKVYKWQCSLLARSTVHMIFAVL